MADLLLWTGGRKRTEIEKQLAENVENHNSPMALSECSTFVKGA